MEGIVLSRYPIFPKVSNCDAIKKTKKSGYSNLIENSTWIHTYLLSTFGTAKPALDTSR